MGFFDPIEPDEVGAPRVRRNPWAGPPENEIGVLVPVQVELVHARDIGASVVGVVACSTGFTVRISTRDRPDGAAAGQPMIRPWASGEDQFRFGVGFSDGRKATNVQPRPLPGDEAPPIRLSMQGGSGGGGLSWDVGYWVYPLPPPGPVIFAAEWAKYGVAEQIHEVEAELIIEAAARAEKLWDDPRPFAAPGS